MINQAEIERIKQSVDIRELASSYVALQGSHEMSGPCPKCGGEDRFHCKAGWFFCRQCHPNRGDAIEFVMWLEGCSFLEACDKLTTGDGFSIPPQPRKPAGKVRSIWTSEQWQKSANREVEQAVHAMNGPSGEQGRRYLEGRAIVDTTWKAWRLGYVPRVERRYQVDSEWHRDDLGPAISLPWTENGAIKAVQYRFIGAGKMRYWQKCGGDRTLFGLHLLKGRSTLIVCEGELNAVSIWQAANDTVDVISFGSDGNLVHAADALRMAAADYDHVIVWADKEEKSRACQEIVGPTARALKSPRGLDANDLLQRGQLRDFVIAALKKYDVLEITREQSMSSQPRLDVTPQGMTAEEGMPTRIAELLGRPLLLEDKIASLCFWVDQHNAPIVWQRYDLNDPFAGWQNVN